MGRSRGCEHFEVRGWFNVWGRKLTKVKSENRAVGPWFSHIGAISEQAILRPSEAVPVRAKAPIGRHKWHGEAGRMSQTEPVIEDSRAVEDLHHLRLMALLHELVREKGNRGAASVLGIDPRTVASCMKTGRLSWRVREALEQRLQSGAGSAAARQRERNDALEGRSEEMEGKLRSGIEEVRAAVAGEVEALREEHARSMRHVERRLVRLEAAGNESETPSPTGARD